jgi:tripartite-type tricarboxylate transporter receptor subunit TctC
LRAIVPVGAGSSTDIVHRLVLEQLSAQLGQPIVVENRAGAGATIGSAFVAKSEPDGYTILAHGSAHTIAPAVYKALAYDAARDFIAVVALGTSPSVLVVPPKGQLGRGARRGGEGATGQPEFFVGRRRERDSPERRPVRLERGNPGRPRALQGRRGGDAGSHRGTVDFFFGPVALVLPHIRDGKLRALAVNGTSRSSVLPEVPTLREAGIADAEYPIWFALFAPARTPPRS